MPEAGMLVAAVNEFARMTRFPVVFGGLIDEAGVTRVTAFHGNQTNALRGLNVAPERGLGGRAVAELRPRLAGDYASAKQITHDYDRYILGEGIGTLIAVPVVLDSRARGVLYGGVHGNWGIGGVSAEPGVRVAEEFARMIAADDARTAQAAIAPSPEVAGFSAAQQEELRSTYAELRVIAGGIEDEALRARLTDVENRLAALAAPSSSGEATDVHLSPREVDVLACAGVGSTNAQIASQLGLRESTVKAYLSSAMAKLDAGTRMAAVAAARRLGLLP